MVFLSCSLFVCNHVICERKGYTRCYYYCLYNIKLHRKNQRIHAIKISEANFFAPDILLNPFLYRNSAFEHDHDFPFLHHADISVPKVVRTNLR